ISLSGNPNYPCQILSFKGITLMFDCALNPLPILSFLPLPLVHSSHFSSLSGWSGLNGNSSSLENEIKFNDSCGFKFVDSSPEFSIPEIKGIEMSKIDVILISNYRSILALPYITQRTNFNGTIYATQPTIILGELFMEELNSSIAKNPKIKKATHWKNSTVLTQIFSPEFVESINLGELQTIYTMDEIHDTILKIKSVSFNEKINMFGILTAHAVSSGYCLGSCNWIIKTPHEKIVYISSSSTLVSHIRAIDSAALKNADIAILGSLSLSQTAKPNARMSEFCDHVERTLKIGGNVLIPCYSSGEIYNLFECLTAHLESCGLGGVPIFFISPIAERSLMYSNIMNGWISESKQNRIFTAEEPFFHSQHIKNGRIKFFDSISNLNFQKEIRLPMVVFVNHPSLRFGEVVHFIELWGSQPNNIMILTEPEFPFFETLAPFQPKSMKVVFCPIDTRMSFYQANAILNEIKPANIVLPYQYTMCNEFEMKNLAAKTQTYSEMMIENENSKLFSYRKNESIDLPLPFQKERLTIHSEIVKEIRQNPSYDKLKLTKVSGILEAKNNRFELAVITKQIENKIRNDSPTLTLPMPRYLIGDVDVNKLVEILNSKGFENIHLNRDRFDKFLIDIV
ncbi:integrator complex subunit 9-like protein, partial [Sarcoptes scabiei]